MVSSGREHWRWLIRSSLKWCLRWRLAGGFKLVGVAEELDYVAGTNIIPYVRRRQRIDASELVGCWGLSRSEQAAELKQGESRLLTISASGTRMEKKQIPYVAWGWKESSPQKSVKYPSGLSFYSAFTPCFASHEITSIWQAVRGKKSDVKANEIISLVVRRKRGMAIRHQIQEHWLHFCAQFQPEHLIGRLGNMLPTALWKKTWMLSNSGRL